MRALMYSCINWGLTKCNVKVSQFARWSTGEGEKEISYGPYGPEVIPFNDICRICGYFQIEIREKRCNVCESTDIQLMDSGGNEKNPDTEGRFLYRCNNCDSNLVSDIKL